MRQKEKLPAVQLQHTLNHVDCPACEATRLELNRKTEMRHLKFRDAAELVLDQERFYLLEENAGLVLEDKTLRVGARTYSDHVDFVRRLNRFFAEIPLEKVHEGHWREYQKGRAQSAGPCLINHELSFLVRVLDRAGLWKQLKPLCPSLEVHKSNAGRAITAEERKLILETAASLPRCKPFYLAALLMLNTTSNQGEVIHLRIKDLDMKRRLLQIREGRGVLKLQPDGTFRHAPKTGFRERELPMTNSAFWVCLELLKRYRRICRRLKLENSPEHYLFPGRRRGGTFDPTRHIGSFKTAWNTICAKAGITNLRIEDFRHEVSTKLQNDPLTTPATVERIMGHGPDTQTKRDYFHGDHQVMLQALERIEVQPVPRSVESVDKVLQLPVPQEVTNAKKTS